jgi:hypothetical protein
MIKDRENLTLKYKFSFAQGTSREFLITLDPRTLKLIAARPENPPSWTHLEYNKCPNCPLDEIRHPNCPIALSIIDVVDFFKDLVSYEKTYISIESGSRTFIGTVPLQEAIKSLVSVFMVTSGCPIMDQFRPMMRSALPFPNMEESVYRILSMYLFAQYFLMRDGKKPDWDLKKLLQICNDVQVVNRSFFKRLRGLKIKDASLNALVAIDSVAAFTASFLEEGNFEDIRMMFQPYLDQQNKQK